MKTELINDLHIVSNFEAYVPSQADKKMLEQKKTILFIMKGSGVLDPQNRTTIGKIANEYGYKQFIKIQKRFYPKERYLLIAANDSVTQFTKDNLKDYWFTYEFMGDKLYFDKQGELEQTFREYKMGLEKIFEGVSHLETKEPIEFVVPKSSIDQQAQFWDEFLTQGKQNSYELVVMTGIDYNDGFPIGGILCQMEDLGNIIMTRVGTSMQWFAILPLPFIQDTPKVTKDVASTLINQTA